MKITVSNQLELTGIPYHFRQAVCNRLTFDNPAHLEAVKMGRWTGNIPEVLRFYQDPGDGTLTIPRGFCRQLILMCRKNGIRYEIEDRRRALAKVQFNFTGILKLFQQQAVDAMLARDFGTLSAPTGSGKTVMALAIIAERRQPALIVVHTKELLNQWVERIGVFLGIPANEIGIIGNGKKSIGGRITVALVQSLYKVAGEVSPLIGHLVVDECHRAPSRTFTEAVTAFDCRYQLGLSATPWRRDKLSRLIFFHLGDVVHEVDREALQEAGDILRAEVITRETSFKPFSDPVTEYSTMLSELTEDPERNNLIAQDVAAEANNGGGIVLVLS
ncbi:MAG: DEAD/DEAH box helicase, partial [Desulfobacteraceae bacterium]